MPSPEAMLLRLNLSSPGFVGGGGSAFGNLTRQDIAAALGMGGLAEHLNWLAQVMYCDDRSNLSRLAKTAWLEFALYAKREGWQRSHWQRGSQLFRACAVIALFEFLEEPGRRCASCNGTGLAPKRKLADTAAPDDSALPAPMTPGNCPRCNGYSIVELLPSARLDLLNEALGSIGVTMASSSWYEIWQHRHYHALVMLRGWHGDLKRHIRRYTRIEQGVA